MTYDENSDGPPYFGLPEHSPFTIEGQLEQGDMGARHALRARKGKERSVGLSDWAPGLWFFAAVFAFVIGLFVLLYFFG